MTKREEESVQSVPGYEEADYPYIHLKMKGVTITGNISAFTQAAIMWIKTLHGSTWQNIFDGTNKTAAVIPVGVSWELHVNVSSTNITGGYVVGVSYRIGTQAAFLSDRKVIGGSYWEKEFAFNMGAMPAAGVAFDHIKFWISDFYTTSQPPQADW